MTGPFTNGIKKAAAKNPQPKKYRESTPKILILVVDISHLEMST